MKVVNHVVQKPSRTQSGRSIITSHAKVNQKSSKKSSPKKESKTSKSKSSGGDFFSFFASKGMIQVYGVLLLTIALLVSISIVSFYFHAHNNLFYVEGQETTAHNIARSVGAYIAYFFVQDIFGVISIGFPFLFFLYGIRILSGKNMLPLGRTTIATILSMAWVSTALGLFFANGDNTFVCGFFGVFAANALLSLGKVVAAIIVILVFFIILILCYDISLKNMVERAQEAYANRPQKESKPKAGRNRKSKEDAEQENNSNHYEDLDDLYISDHGCLSKEYSGNTTTWEIEPTAEQLAAQKNKQEALEKLAQQPEQQEEVPFELVNQQTSTENLMQEEDPDEDVEETETNEKEQLTAEDVRNLPPYDPRAELSSYEFPSIDLLLDYPAKEANEELMKRELLDNKKRIEATLNSFGIPIRKISATVGPTVTLYEIVPAEGVRISKIKNLEDDIALSLAALGIRIIAPIPGRGTIGIEVPNKNANIVSMKEIITSDKFQNNSYALPIGLGRTISNEPFVVDLAKMPHLLVAGATGQGKSVGLNAIITSLLYTKHPCEMKFVLIDPKKVEFTLYSVIENYYLAKLPDNNEAIITDTKKVVRTLNSLCVEMDQRYDLLKLAKMRNIKEYNAKFCARELSPAMGHRYLPYIVLVIDEFGDLIMTAGREVEQPLARLAQLARAIGIHLVIATQRPSVNIITGSIKANFPARIAFRVQSSVDSRTILDTTGANQLIGKGDMLISTGSDLVRLQCAFVDTPEVEKIAEFIEQQSELKPLLEPYALPDVPEPGNEPDTNFDDEPASGEIDPLFVDAAVLVVQSQQGSTSYIQRRMKLGYNRAGRIMDQLEDFNIVGPANGSKPRDVLVKTDAQLRELLASKGML